MTAALVDISAFDEITDPLQYRVMTVLASLADRQERAWPSLVTLAARVKRSVKTVRKAMRALEAAGELRVWRRHKRRNIYYLRRISGPGSPRRADKRLPLQGSQKSGGTGGASRPPVRPASPAPMIAPAGGSRDIGAPAFPTPARTVLPEGWLPPDEDIGYALDHTGQNIRWCQREIRKFLDHSRDQGRVSACWQLEWRRWIARGLAYREKRLRRASRRIAA
jgi:hypothetical protein